MNEFYLPSNSDLGQTANANAEVNVLIDKIIELSEISLAALSTMLLSLASGEVAPDITTLSQMSVTIGRPESSAVPPPSPGGSSSEVGAVSEDLMQFLQAFGIVEVAESDLLQGDNSSSILTALDGLVSAEFSRQVGTETLFTSSLRSLGFEVSTDEITLDRTIYQEVDESTAGRLITAICDQLVKGLAFQLAENNVPIDDALRVIEGLLQPSLDSATGGPTQNEIQEVIESVLENTTSRKYVESLMNARRVDVDLSVTSTGEVPKSDTRASSNEYYNQGN